MTRRRTSRAPGLSKDKSKAGAEEDDLPFIKVGEESKPSEVEPRVSGDQRQVHFPSKEEDRGKFMNNAIRTTKYTWYNFLFKNIVMEQLRRVANFYFLCIAALQLVPGLSNVTPASSITPLVFVIGVSAIKEAIEDSRRGRSDKQVNNRVCKIVDREASKAAGAEHLVSRKWSDLNVGDVVKLEKDEMVPADLVILCSGLPQGLSFLETANLDGETNLKIYQALEQTVAAACPEKIGQFECTVFSEPPNNRLYVFEGSIRLHGPDAPPDELSLSAKQMLLRGCALRNTPWVYGLVVFSGFDTKLMRNQTAAPSKRSSLEIQMNGSLLLVFLFLFVCAFVGALFSQLDVGHAHWYIHGDRDDDRDGVPDNSHFAFRGNVLGFFFNMGSFIVLYSSMVPISLYVTLELCKLVQTVFMAQDVHMYHAPKDQPALVRTSNLTEELGQIEYIFSDKTGTLTCNEMVFQKLSVGGTSYDVRLERASHDPSVANDGGDGALAESGGAPTPGSAGSSPRGSAKRRSRLRLSQSSGAGDDDQGVSHGRGSTGRDGDAAATDESPRGHRDLSLTAMRQHLRADNRRGRLLDQFWTLLAVCHTVIPENHDAEGVPQGYQAESPDELALVEAAKAQGFVLISRSTNSVSLLNHGVREDYRVLNINDFNSTRKRMSTVFECPDGRIRLMIKGADNVIKSRLSTHESSALVRRTDSHLEAYSREGLRTLLCASRELDPDEYKRWNAKYHAASIAVKDRGAKMDHVAELIETDLQLLGATAIEDKLQDEVPRTIANLSRAGIRLWVLTGDKIETAINIARSCNLIVGDMQVARVTGSNPAPLLAGVIDQLHITPADFMSGRGGGGAAPSRRWAEAAAGDQHWEGGGSHHRPEMALVLDGSALEVILGDRQLELQLLMISHRIKSIVCCRVSPLQKSLCVKLVRENLGVRCLAIGDGANDVSMIQEAHVGIGISGNEGMQAVMSSDYAIAQFKFLEPLLLVHGRWNYKRVCKLVLYSFYKNMTYILTQLWFNMFSAKYSAQNLFDSWTLAVYNLLFTAAPVMVYAILEQDVSRETVLKFPQLYETGLYNYEFNSLLVWTWIGNSLYSSAIIWFGCRFAFDEGQWSADGTNGGLWVLGASIYTVVVFVVNGKIALEFRHWTGVHWGFLIASVAAWFVYASIYNMNFFTNPASFHNTIFAAMSTAYFWCMLVIITFLCLLPDIAFKYLTRQYYPENYQILQECERTGRQFSEEERSAIGQQIGDMTPIHTKFANVVTEMRPVRVAKRGGRTVKQKIGRRLGRGYDQSAQHGMLDALRILQLYKPQRNPAVGKPDTRGTYVRPSSMKSLNQTI